MGAPPSHWPALTLCAATVLLEAEGESEQGQLAVAWVIRTRVDRHPMLERDPEADLLRAVILAPKQFSCWNESGRLQALERLKFANSRTWEACWKAAVSAWWRLVPDPTQGATNYLNVELTRQGRPQHDLPPWVDMNRMTVVIGAHTFLRLYA